MRAIAITVLCVFAFIETRASACCPLCLAPTQTWSEIISESSAVVLATLSSRDEGSASRSPSAKFEIVRVHKGRKRIEGKRHIRIEDFVVGQPGDLFLLTASERDENVPLLYDTFATETPRPDIAGAASMIRKVSAIRTESASGESLLQWDAPTPVSNAEYAYITDSPVPDVPVAERLTYFLSYLESDSGLIASDAWGEFARADYEAIKDRSNLFSSARLRDWIANAETSPERLSLYGLMLGMCGDAADGEFLKEQIGAGGAEELRFGVEGLMAGLLALEGESGLQFLEKTRLQHDIPMLESYAVVQAIQFAWNHESEKIPKERLQKSLWLTLNDESLREISIRNLARWQDWDALAKLPAVYEQCRSDDTGTTQAITGFLVVYLRDHMQASENDRAAATELLETIRRDAPRVVRAVEWELRSR